MSDAGAGGEMSSAATSRSDAREGPEANADGQPIEPSRYADRIESLADEARATREALPVADDPNPQRAVELARDGLGSVVACYVEARTSDDPPRFSAREHRLLQRATRDWLTCYARHVGVAHESDATVRGAAELLLATHDVVEVARRLTGVRAR